MSFINFPLDLIEETSNIFVIEDDFKSNVNILLKNANLDRLVIKCNVSNVWCNDTFKVKKIYLTANKKYKKYMFNTFKNAKIYYKHSFTNISIYLIFHSNIIKKSSSLRNYMTQLAI